MRKIVILLICLIPSLLFAADYTFVWDANTESDLDGYRLYQSSTPGGYVFGDGNQVATAGAGDTSITITGVAAGDWYWVLTAFDYDGNESGPSNEVNNIAPMPPQGFKFSMVWGLKKNSLFAMRYLSRMSADITE